MEPKQADPVVFLDDEDRALQKAIFESLTRTTTSSTPSSSINSLSEKILNNLHLTSVSETGQSSSSNSQLVDDHFICQICFEQKPSLTDSFSVKSCIHIFCKECISSYVSAKLQDSITLITCPSTDCNNGTLRPYDCRDILPTDVFQRWGDLLCESLIVGSEKYYCPFKDCSALLIFDDGITVSECPHCNRLFCAQCKSSWHLGMECEEFQKLEKGENDREDIMLMYLAKDNKWKRCPKCKIFVEKSSGCMYMKCRCNFAFCYNCGAASATGSHICSKCGH